MLRTRLLPRTLTALCFALALLAGCVKAPVQETAAPVRQDAEAVLAQEVRFSDMGGNEIVLPAPAARIAALTPADAEMLFAIGAGSTLVGCGEYCDYPEAAKAIPVIQTGVDINMEKLLQLQPEILLLNPEMLATGNVASTQEQVKLLRGAGVTVVVTNPLDIAGVYETINMLGVLTGHTDGAEQVVSGMRAEFDAIADDRPGAGRTVYFEISPLEYGLWTAGTGTFMDEIAEMLGLVNCFADVSGWGEISEEQVLSRDPDYIVTIAMYGGDGLTPEEEILSRPGWENITAVQNGAILCVQDNSLSRPGPRLADGARLLYGLIAGEQAENKAA